MLTNTQLKPLFDLISDLNNSAAADGCQAPYVVLDGSILEKVMAEAKRLQQEPFIATVEHITLLKNAGLTFGECTQAFGSGETDPYVLSAQDRASEGNLEMDGYSVVSHSENGAYVQAWMWVSDSAIVADHRAKAESAGYKVHLGTEEDGELEDRYWWTFSRPGMADTLTSPEDFEEEDDAWASAIINYFEWLKSEAEKANVIKQAA